MSRPTACFSVVLICTCALCFRPNGLYNITGTGESSPAWRSLWQRIRPTGSRPVARLSIVHGDTVSEARQEFGEWATLVTRWAPGQQGAQVPTVHPRCIDMHRTTVQPVLFSCSVAHPELCCGVLCPALLQAVPRPEPCGAGVDGGAHPL